MTEILASQAQQAMWHVHRLAPDSSVYHVVVRARVVSGLDVDVLQVAVDRLVDRHAALRTTFRESGGAVYQVVHDRLRTEVSTPAPAPPEEFEQQLRASMTDPFDLTVEGPTRLVLHADPAGGHVLVLVFHHIAWDFESIALALRELGEHYRDVRTGTATKNTPRPPGYHEFAEWERDWLTGPDAAASLDHWAKRWDELPAALELPADRPRPPARSYAGAMHWGELDAEQVRAVDEFARSAKVTRYAVLLTLFEVALRRFTGQPEVTVGIAGSQRVLPEFRWSIGNFVNPLVLAADVAPERTFRDLVRANSAAVFDAVRHRIAPFPLLVERARPDYDPSRAPLFDVLLAYDKTHRRDDDTLAGFVAGNGAVDLGGLSLRSEPADCAATFYELTLYLFDNTDSVKMRWEYSTQLFDEATVARLDRQTTALLDELLAAPDTPLANLAAADEPAPATATPDVYGLVARHAAATPDAPAVTVDGETVTWAELLGRAGRTTAAPGRSIDGVAAAVAALRSGTALARDVAWLAATCPLDATDRVLAHHPVDTEQALAELLWPLACGAHLVVADSIREAGVTTVQLSPADAPQWTGDPVPGLRRVLYRGPVPSVSTARALRRWAGVDATFVYTHDDRPLGLLTLDGWRPALGSIPPDARLSVPGVLPGGVGTLHVRGLPTGDLARHRADGGWELVGSAARRVRVHPYTVQLDEIERLLESHAAVAEAVVRTVPTDATERLVAFVRPTEPGAFDPARLRAELRDLRPGYQVPVDVYPVSTVDDALRAGAQDAAFTGARRYLPPATPLERELATMWQDLLGVARVGRDDNFFEIGGYSLMASRLGTEVSRRFGVELPAAAVFRAPTLERFAVAVLRRLVAASAAA